MSYSTMTLAQSQWLAAPTDSEKQMGKPRKRARKNRSATRGVASESKRGDAYQLAVAEVAASIFPNAVIEVGVWVDGPDGRRDLDVVVRPEVGAPPLLYIECKDWTRPIGIGLIDALESKRRDIGAGTAMMCSNSGYTADALQKAARVNIPVLAALIEGDQRIRVEIEEMIYSPKIQLQRAESSIAGDLGGLRKKIESLESFTYDGKSMANWHGAQQVVHTLSSPRSQSLKVTYNFRQPFELFVPSEGVSVRINSIALGIAFRVTWHAKARRIRASKGMYDYVRKCLIHGPEPFTAIIDNVSAADWGDEVDLSEVPKVHLSPFGQEVRTTLGGIHASSQKGGFIAGLALFDGLPFGDFGNAPDLSPRIESLSVVELGDPPKLLFEATATQVGHDLEKRTTQRPEDAAVLDRYEQLIEEARLAGRMQDAYDLYYHVLGGYQHLAKKLGDYTRAYRILRGFAGPSDSLENFGFGLTIRDRAQGLAELGLLAANLGRLNEASGIRRQAEAFERALGETLQTNLGLRATLELALDLGRLAEALAAAREAVADAERAQHNLAHLFALGARATVQHQLGDIAAARDDFATARRKERSGHLLSLRGRRYAHHCLDLGNLTACRVTAEVGLRDSTRQGQAHEIPAWHAIFARLALAEGQDPVSYIEDIRRWTARTGGMELILEAHGLAARAALMRGDLQGARAEVDEGLRQARLWGYRLRQIELLVTLSSIEFARPDADRAVAAAREALDLATATDCMYAWGEADAAHALGMALEALGKREEARRAFGQALAVRERIEHPQAEATRAALARLD